VRPADENPENGDDQDRGTQDQTDHPVLVFPVAPLRVFAKAGHVRAKPLQCCGEIGFHNLYVLLFCTSDRCFSSSRVSGVSVIVSPESFPSRASTA